jgi:hypothetical protein
MLLATAAQVASAGSGQPQQPPPVSAAVASRPVLPDATAAGDTVARAGDRNMILSLRDP